MRTTYSVLSALIWLTSIPAFCEPAVTAYRSALSGYQTAGHQFVVAGQKILTDESGKLACSFLKIPGGTMQSWLPLPQEGQPCYAPRITDLRISGTGGSVTDALPEFARNHTDKLPNADGPNCMNAVLQWWGIEKDSRYVMEEDFRKSLALYFQEIPVGAKLEFGDVIVDEKSPDEASHQFGINHAAIYIDAFVLWNKLDAGSNTPWMFQSTEQVFESGGFPDGNHRIRFYRFSKDTK